MQSEEEKLLIDLTQKLLDCIAAGDWDTYCELCHPSLTCFEPEAVGNLISGLEFHRFYFDIAKNSTAPSANHHGERARPLDEGCGRGELFESDAARGFASADESFRRN